MERRVALACFLLAVSSLAGCGSASPAATAVQHASDGPSATAPEANAPTLVPGAVTAPPLGSGPLELTAMNIDFEPKELVAPTGRVAMTFHNRDDAIPHTVAINDASGNVIFQAEIVTGPADLDIVLPDMPPGTYTYICTVHPNMTGTLTVLP
jgi:plastocyanin